MKLMNSCLLFCCMWRSLSNTKYTCGRPRLPYLNSKHNQVERAFFSRIRVLVATSLKRWQRPSVCCCNKIYGHILVMLPISQVQWGPRIVVVSRNGWISDIFRVIEATVARNPYLFFFQQDIFGTRSTFHGSSSARWMIRFLSSFIRPLKGCELKVLSFTRAPSSTYKTRWQQLLPSRSF